MARCGAGGQIVLTSRCSTVHHGAVLYITVQYCTSRCSTVRDGISGHIIVEPSSVFNVLNCVGCRGSGLQAAAVADGPAAGCGGKAGPRLRSRQRADSQLPLSLRASCTEAWACWCMSDWLCPAGACVTGCVMLREACHGGVVVMRGRWCQGCAVLASCNDGQPCARVDHSFMLCWSLGA